MTVPFLDLKIADASMNEEIDNKLLSLVHASSFIAGPEVEGFAKEFGEFCAARCVAVANGTDALVLALRAMGVGPGDEVITVPFTFIATAEAISLVGAKTRFVDIHPRNYTMDPTLIEKAITSRTKAILPVHLFGQPADMDPIMDIARQRKLKVLEDACQSHGATYKGRPTGSLGDAAAFSFYPTKNLGGFGDGGAVTTLSAELAEKVTRLGDHGRTDRYLHAVEGSNSRLDAFQAAVLRIKLRRLAEWNEQRRAIALRYQTAFQDHHYLSLPTVESYAKHVFHLYCVESSHRDDLQRFLSGEKIGCGVYYPIPLHLQPAYAYLGHKRGDFPVSERAAERILALPMFPQMTEAHVSRVIEVVRSFRPAVTTAKP